MKKKIAWVDPNGTLHTIFANDMDDAVRQIDSLRETLGFSNDRVALAAIDINGNSVKDYEAINVNELSPELRDSVNKSVAESLERMHNKSKN